MRRNHIPAMLLLAACAAVGCSISEWRSNTLDAFWLPPTSTAVR
jgi:hypothetical protein